MKTPPPLIKIKFMNAAAKKKQADYAAQLQAARAALEDAKGRDIVTLEFFGKTPLFDAMLICTAASSRHAATLADRAERALRKSGAHARREGDKGAEWILLDGGAVVAHIFLAEARARYDLEGLWQPELLD